MFRGEDDRVRLAARCQMDYIADRLGPAVRENHR